MLAPEREVSRCRLCGGFEPALHQPTTSASQPHSLQDGLHRSAQCYSDMVQLNEIESSVSSFVLADERLWNIQLGSNLDLRQFGFMT